MVFSIFLESFLDYIDIMHFYCTCIVSGQSALMLLINVCMYVYIPYSKKYTFIKYSIPGSDHLLVNL